MLSAIIRQSSTRLKIRCLSSVRFMSTGPSKEYMSKVGEQPIPGESYEATVQSSSHSKVSDPQEEDKKQLIKVMKRRSLRMTFWQMFLVTFIGSCALNIMREKNSDEEYNDNYHLRFKSFDKVIKKLSKGDITIEEIEDELATINERFESVFHLPGSFFDGLRGLDRKKLKEVYHQYKDIPLEEARSDSGLSTDSQKQSEQINHKKAKLNTFL
ncbi:hypothetical protein FOA43_004194 [Brettanomyces nanus]|uniref:Uncharacterized protein n=1 Tax=Eeniella nana TaxID=13502 RepID=A0A875RQF6_EENNA|nr:uncharacterized protein FOA43_004194 [Brettanomyces nanus]QPG76800.1 hypothetical protein FOA43_004194 [Brettanomyces nanus]